MRIFLLFCLVFFTLFIFGCGAPRIDLNIASQANVNPDHSGRPSPVIVKMYELKSDLAFNQSDFSALFSNPMQTLGADLLAADEITLVPGEVLKIAYQPTLETKFVGIVAGFRQMERAHWRIIKPVVPEEGGAVDLEFNDASVILIPDDQAGDWTPEEAVKEFQERTAAPPAETINEDIVNDPRNKTQETSSEPTPAPPVNNGYVIPGARRL